MSEIDAAGKLLIGLTGNIATGKSAVMRLAAEEGALTIDADKVVHDLMNGNANLQAAIGVAFGEGVRREDGRINRKALGDIVFKDKQALADLEQITHPAVRKEIGRRISESEADIVMIEAIKLLEGGLADSCHQIWVTTCPDRTQLERLRVCRGMETPAAVMRIKAQGAQADKIAKANVVIDTSGFMRETEAKFAEAWANLPAPGEAAVADKETADSLIPAKPTERPDDLEVRRARPSDIASVLLLIQKATEGKLKLKRSDLLMALGERSYFIGQQGTSVNTVIGWNIENLVARITDIYFHPLDEAVQTIPFVLDDIRQSAYNHICELMAAFIPNDAPPELEALFRQAGYDDMDIAKMPRDWKAAIKESQPENTTMLGIVLRERVTHPM